MKDLFELAYELQSFLDSQDWRFCFIGGIALQRWGEPRLTTDIDMTLLAGFGGEEAVVEELLKCYETRIGDALGFAQKNRVVLLKSPAGIGIDIALGGLPFEDRVMDRATEYEFLPDQRLKVCSAEDLIVMKAFAERDQDWLDVAGVITRQGARLDWQTIWDELRPLAELKEAPGIINRLEALRDEQIGRSSSG